MSATIKIKNSSTTGAVPTSGDLVQGELAVNVTDTGLYTENASGTVVKLNAPSIDDKNTGATKHVTIDTSGNLGLGVTPSAWASVWKANQLGSTGFVAGRTNAERFYAGSNAYYNGTNWIYLTTGYATYYASNLGQHEWYNAASGTAGNAISFTQAMTLDASGNLGIGSTSPAAKLDVAAGSSSTFAKFSSSNADPYFRIQNTSAGGKDWIIYSSGTGSSLPGTFRLFNNTDNLTAFTVDSSGNLLVGTTSGSSSARAVIRREDLTSTTKAANIIAKLGPGTGTSRDANIVLSDFSAYDYYFGGRGGVAYVTVNNNQGVQLSAGATSWSSDSDETLKDIIEPIENAIEAVNSWRTVIGKYKSDNDGTRRVFFMAQDIQTTTPEAVDLSPEGTLLLRYQDTIPVLAAAIKEQQAIITALTARIEALEQA